MSLLRKTSVEKQIEKQVCVWAKFNAILIYKMFSKTQVGWPDRMFLYKGKLPLFIEFKRKGFDPTAVQTYMHGLLRQYGYQVEVCHSVKEAKEVINKWLL